MPTFWAKRSVQPFLAPLKVQAQKIKNVGKFDIYIHSLEEDLPLPCPSNIIPICPLYPGYEIDISAITSIIWSISAPDYDVTIHSNQEIEVEVTSSALCDRWEFDTTHPWNTGYLPNGMQTKKFGGLPNGPVKSALNGLMSGSNVTFTVNGVSMGQLNAASVSFNETPPIIEKCICTSRTLFNAGCICGFLKRK